MSDRIFTVKDMLSIATAEMDQLQAQIDKCRSMKNDDPSYDQYLDEFQTQLDERRKRAKIMRDIANIIEP